MPTRPASKMQPSTNGINDQNMSRPSCSNRGLAGLATGPAAGAGSPAT